MTDMLNFSRVLIANRGEIALRAIRVCRQIGLETVSVYSVADTASPHVWAADHAVCIGPPSARDSYLNVKTLLHVCQQMNCDAIYPGYGFLAENADFAEQCSHEGIKFIGPSATHIRTMGDKSKARETAENMGVPVVPGSESAYVDIDKAHAASANIGYPLLLKARSGGGGRGMRIVQQETDFASAFAEANREAEAAFNDGAIYMERFFPNVRHIEIQVIGDGKGGSIQFDERDCSVQRRHQKLIEESPSPVVSPELRERLIKAAAKLTRGIHYEGAGTIEFILDTQTDEFFFIEMNTRIQVEHSVTEMRVGLDLIEIQFDIAQGKPLPLLDKIPAPGGHTIEFRINAEDWTRDFQPTPGVLSLWSPPQGEDIRLDSATYQGQRISPFYDSMIAKLILRGTDREDALAKARDALAGFRCAGIATTIDFHRMLIEHEDYHAARVHTRWIENELLANN